MLWGGGRMRIRFFGVGEGGGLGMVYEETFSPK